jgi:anti-sigma regulatory factor (Ser/Thr protein kinase)
MCRLASKELGSSPDAVPESRTFVSTALRRWGLEELVMDAELLTSELVTNALVHARTEVQVAVAVADGVAEIGVTDGAPGVPEQRISSYPSEGGRGLRLVDAVAQEWGVANVGSGKQVWFRLDVSDEWPYRNSCPCGGEDLDRVRLDSGRWAVPAAGPWDEEDSPS